MQAPASTPAPFPDPIPSIIPFGGISLLAGAPGTGKTALLATLLKAFRDQQPIFGHQPSPLPSIDLICVDRSWTTNSLWFDRAGYADISVYSLADDQAFSKARLRRKADRIKIFTELVDKLPYRPGGMVVADPIALFFGGNLIDYDTCMVSCLELREVLHAKSLTLLGTAHTAKLRADKKDRYMRLQDQILGSTALFGFTDTQMYLASPEELAVPHYTFLWAPHMAPPQTFDLTRDTTGLFIPYSKEHGGNPERLIALIQPDEVLSYTEIVDRAQAIPLSRSTVTRVLDFLKQEGRIGQTESKRYHVVRPA